MSADPMSADPRFAAPRLSATKRVLSALRAGDVIVVSMNPRGGRSYTLRDSGRTVPNAVFDKLRQEGEIRPQHDGLPLEAGGEPIAVDQTWARPRPGRPKGS